jgi:hypothetical protein
MRGAVAPVGWRSSFGALAPGADAGEEECPRARFCLPCRCRLPGHVLLAVQHDERALADPALGIGAAGRTW